MTVLDVNSAITILRDIHFVASLLTNILKIFHFPSP